jgi:flagellin-like protein
MRGVSEVIAIILILMITIAIAGLAYMFMSTTMSDVTSSAGSTVDTTTSSMSTSFTIESISQGKVYVRNTGQGALTGLSVYVSDQAVNASVPASIASRAVGTINVTSIIFEGDSIRVTSSNGVSAPRGLLPSGTGP